MGLSGTLAEATRMLARTSGSARLDAELLMAHALGIERSQLLLRQRDLDPPPAFAELLQRRVGGEPLAYIVGRRGFWTLDLVVTPDVLIPRPDSETLIEMAAQELADSPPCNILDLGTGSGALLLAALTLFPEAIGTGIDASKAAIAVASRNANDNGLADRAEFIFTDWNADGWRGGLADEYDLVIANPPYIRDSADLMRDVLDHEPSGALFAGPDGLDAYRAIIPQLPDLISSRGVAIFEIGYDQHEQVVEIAAQHGFSAQAGRDLSNHVRALLLQQSGPMDDKSLGIGPKSR